MIRSIARHILFGPLASISALISMPAWASDWQPPGNIFVYAIIVLVLLGAFGGLIWISVGLRNTKWSFADAISEEVEVTAMKPSEDGKPPQPWINDKDGKPIMITEMRASASRLIALFGMLVILLMFFGFGAFSLFHFAKTGEMPNGTLSVMGFLAAGMVLFAPYVVNKFAAIFDNFKIKPQP